MWDRASQTLSMGFGTAIFCIEADGYSFLMALTVATNLQDALNLDVELNGNHESLEKWFDHNTALFQDSATHTDTYHGHLSPRHQLDIILKKGSEPGEGCWFLDINVTLCEPELSDNSQSHSNRPDSNRPGKIQLFKSIFS